MSQSHTGRNGMLQQSIQSVKQREKFNSRGIEGENTSRLSIMFSNSPVYKTFSELASSGEEDRATFFTNDKDLYQNFKNFRSSSITGGFGFEDLTINMNYKNGNPNIDENGIASTDSLGTKDINDGTNSIKGHANLSVNKFNTNDFSQDSSTQVIRNNDIPGVNVDNSRADILGQYFTGAGNRDAID